MFAIERLIRGEVSQDEVLNELHDHHHPRTRIIKQQDGTNRLRRTQEARQELIDHYIYAHNLMMA